MSSRLGSVSKTHHSFTPFSSNPSEFEQTTEKMLQRCLGELSAESASLFLKKSTNGDLQLVKAVGSRENRHCGKVVSIGSGISGSVAARRKPLLVASVSESKKGITKRKQMYPVDTFMSCPVVNGPSLVGVINVSGRKAGLPFSRADLRKLQKISQRCEGLLSGTAAFDFVGQESASASQARHGGAKHVQELGDYNASILGCLSQYVVIFDGEFNITYCNREKDLASLFGQKEGASIPRRNILDLPVDVERNKLKDRLESLLGGGSPFSLNDVAIKGSPEFRVVNLVFSPFCTAEGNLLGGLLLLDDNTKNHEMQRRLAEAEKFSLIGSLTSMITHEVNNPLDGVMRLINLSMAHVREDDPVREYLGEAQKGLQRIASLVRSLLSFSRKSASLNGEYSPLNTVVRNAATAIQNRFYDKRVSLHLDLAPEDPTVSTNDFYQVVGNLLVNAFDAAAAEKGTVGVKTAMEAGTLSLTVEDDGCGMPKHVQSHIFNTFWSTKDYGKGTGLGLAIVKKIVEKYDGKIEVQSEENAGTRMRVIIPLGNLSL